MFSPSPVDARKARILLVDDHPIVREGLVSLINRQEDMVICGQEGEVDRAIKALEELNPDLVIVDISLGGSSGIELIKSIKTRRPKLPVLALSMHDESLYAERALRAGAYGYVMKREATEKLLSAVRRLLNGGVCVSDFVTKSIVRRAVDGTLDAPDHSPGNQLSDRELQVFQMIGLGLGTREIAKELSLSVKTVETHCTHIKQKLNVKNSTLLIRAAVEWTSESSR
jgi:DNA-binding NarL/FixJ family response regulator